MNKLVLLLLFIVVVGGVVVLLSNTRSNETSVVSDLPTPTGVTDIPEGWQTYTHETLRYSISYPSSYALEPNGDNSILIVKPSDQPGQGPSNFIYISVIPKGQEASEGTIYNYNQKHVEKLQTVEVGESVSLVDEGVNLDEWYTYTRVDNATIDGVEVAVFENTKPWEFPTGTTETRYIFEKNETMYLLGYYTGGDSSGTSSPIDPREAYKIILSFQETQ